MMPDQEQMTEIDAREWEETVVLLGKEASCGTGLVYMLYQSKFKSLVGAAISNLPEKHRQEAKLIADRHGFSEPDEEIGEGECHHGLDPFYCPAGCGDLDDGWPSEEAEIPDDVD